MTRKTKNPRPGTNQAGAQKKTPTPEAYTKPSRVSRRAKRTWRRRPAVDQGYLQALDRLMIGTNEGGA
ncbi:hypothetical protein [Ectothiorhodospira lacustris]|uniref:hypothetical protein n=1 Tax=Ectothiorhodospira lacustris TaxID=2899127 RepID=UPI001EE81611|nr:hypothetical protein [Ectothiorhodospira lacustris]MCG5509623.1 hypothetical protein [Ectothiorhodospira lacustris]MCG5521582.1 hypothetical protein [Ectothiorhodospira lacustris]